MERREEPPSKQVMRKFLVPFFKFQNMVQRNLAPALPSGGTATVDD